MAYMDTSAELVKFSQTPEAFIKRLGMCASMWGCCYDESREFELKWEILPNGMARLADVADLGIYSFYVEGLISRFLMYHTPEVPASTLDAFTDMPPPKASEGSKSEGGTQYRHQILPRSKWKAGAVSDQDWEDLRETLYEIFFQNGRGFFASDLQYTDMAIDWLKSAKECIAGSCSRLAEEVPAQVVEDQFFDNMQVVLENKLV